MNFFRTLLHYAQDAWNFITGLPGDVSSAILAVWHFVASVQNMLTHIAARVIKPLLEGYLGLYADIIRALEDLLDNDSRIGPWIYATWIYPLWRAVLARIASLRAWVQRQLNILRALVFRLYLASLQYTNREVSLERKYRLDDIRMARNYSLRLVNAALAEVQREAATGYKAGNKQRVSTVQKITDDIATRNPVIKALVSDFVKLLIDFLGASNPVERIVLQLALTKIVNHLGVDKVAGNLLQALVGPLIGNPDPRNLHDVCANLAQRVSAIEGRWADYMDNGGPEQEQQGRQLKSLTSVVTDVALLGFFGLMATEPNAWATGVADTIGTVVNDSAAAAAAVIRKA